MLDTAVGLNIFKINIPGYKNQKIFKSEVDYQEMLKIINENMKDNSTIEIIAYCLAQDHCVFLINELEEGAMNYFVQDVSLDYDDYYFEKYGNDGIFDHDNITMTGVDTDDLLNVSRQIHTNRDCWLDCPYSSLRAYLYDDKPEWLNKKYISDIYGSAIEYFEFLSA